MNVYEWLRSCSGVTDVRPVKVTIGNETFEGGRYTQRCEDHIYLLGNLPQNYKKLKGKIAFVVDGVDWYVAAHYQEVAETEHQPFGSNFILMPWTNAERIDHYERTPYARVGMEVVEGW